MTTADEHRIASTDKAAIYLAGILERFAGLDPDQRPDPARIAAHAIQELRDEYGWRLPVNPAAAPPLHGTPAPDDSPGRQAFRQAKADLAARRHT